MKDEDIIGMGAALTSPDEAIRKVGLVCLN
jgi:hypothetical protein